jgi:hypothetical protein
MEELETSCPETYHRKGGKLGGSRELVYKFAFVK